MTGIKNGIQRSTRDYRDGPPLMETVHNLNDMEKLATAQLDRRTWRFNYAAAGDLISKHLDQEVYRSILLRPRILASVKECDLTTTVIGNTVRLPLFVSPMAMARLAHPAGEAGISTACAGLGAMHIISNNASMTPEEIIAGGAPGQIFGFQLYVQNDRSESEAVLARVNKIPAIKCIVLTVDEPVPGKHELGERGFEPYDEVHKGHPSPVQEVSTPNSGVSVAIPSVSGPASDLDWSDTLQWLARHTSLPIIIKGVQTHEDAQIAANYAPLVKAIILSNHGGRVVDTAPPAIHTLLEIRRYCPDVQQKLDIMVDGGVRRGTDVVKALCLGAKAVGIGRPVLWGLGAGGVAGVERVFQILAEETRSCMQLLGVRRVADLGMHHINTSIVETQIYDRG